MEYQYEYFMSDALALPKDAWKPFHNAGPVLSYPKNKLLYNQGDTAFCFYYIVSGRIKTFISSAEGNERLLTIYRRGDILGEAAFFDERPRVSSAQMMADTKVVSIDRPALERCMQQFPALAFSLLRYLSATVLYAFDSSGRHFFSACRETDRPIAAQHGQRRQPYCYLHP